MTARTGLKVHSRAPLDAIINLQTDIEETRWSFDGSHRTQGPVQVAVSYNLRNCIA